MKNEIFGVSYDNYTFSEAVETVAGYLSQDQKRIVLFLNTDYLYKALHDESYAKILSEADLVLPDGIGLKVLSSLKGKKMAGNCNGTDLTPEVLKIAIEKKQKVFFLGGSSEVSARARVNLQQWFAGLEIAGMHSGYFSDDNVVVEQINNSGADILIVSMGAPYQEKWIRRNWDRLKIRLCLAVGGWIDYPGERLKRAPAWVRRMHLEWVGRIVQDPGQMVWRYFRTAVYLSLALLTNNFGKRRS
jgi:N-acetylglucosaminyldiphosphoundecaprenol N-acetyl-beta-D-mannosaminyltransferase